MKTPYLKPDSWIATVKDSIAKKGFPILQGDIYIIPVGVIGWGDLTPEIYGDTDPYSQEQPGMKFGTHYTEVLKTSPEDFDYIADFEANFLPEIQKAEKAANKMVGDNYFLVEPIGDTAEILFIFTPDDIPNLKEKGIIPPDQPGILSSFLIAHADYAFAEFEGPLFERATVDCQMVETPDNNQIPDPSTAVLRLPDLTAKESQAIGRDFPITIKKAFEDKFATTRSYSFTFEVTDMKFIPQPNGLVRPQFKATLKEYRNA